ncbi:putative protease S8 tripeptidyl peptidase I [Xylariaceae sp. FL1651]|nr:putative protease S8 tripeptidyl peptidase I [Xylariaceae sp. FL1651]
MAKLSFSVLLLVVTAAAAVVPRSHVVHEKRDSTGGRWMKRGRAGRSRTLPVRIGLAQSNLDKGYEYLMSVSHPDSPGYGNHWTSEQVIEAFKPSDETVGVVSAWLEENGVTNITHTDNKAWLAFNAPVSVIETLLYAEYHEYEDLITRSVTIATEEYHVPVAIKNHIDYITPGIALRTPPVKRRTASSSGIDERSSFGTHVHQDGVRTESVSTDPHDLSNCDQLITPACIEALYQVPVGSKANSTNAIGVFESSNLFWDQEDLNSFFATYRSDIPNGTHPTDVLFNGAVAETKNVSLAGGEAMLDLCIVYPLVYPQEVVVYSPDDYYYEEQIASLTNFTGPFGYFNTFLDGIDGSYCTYSAYGETGDAPDDPHYPDPIPGGYDGELNCGVAKPTNVLSISYGLFEGWMPIAYMRRQCNEWMKLGLQGVSVLMSSGDTGVAGAHFDGHVGCYGPNQDIFDVEEPSDCPYITSVGATQVYPGHTVDEPESAAQNPLSGYSSGGGFSLMFPTPDYQVDAVNKYFANHNPPYKSFSVIVDDAPYPARIDYDTIAGDTGGVYNRIGRGQPDVSANGAYIATYKGGALRLASGTSASAPIFASIINRINEERLAAGKSVVGFVNPVLYANPHVLNDITNGTNLGCGTEGFSAVEGWDPVTGLGTPNYPKMLDLFMSLP